MRMMMSRPYYEKPPYDGKNLLPMDKVLLSDGREVIINSAHYFSNEGVQMFSVCGSGEELYMVDEAKFIHRHHYNQYKNTDVYKCDCGEIYTTMADFMNIDKSTLN